MDIKVVVHFLDGQIVKGHTYDFFHTRPNFHLRPSLTAPDSPQIVVNITDLKAIFFVKSFDGNKDYVENKGFAPGAKTYGKRVAVTFKDGEQLVGTCTSYRMADQGFFLYPADAASNNERVFCVSQSVNGVEELKA